MTAPREIAQQVIREEARALEQLAAALDSGFDDVLALVQRSASPVILSGLGKSGQIAAKIASSLTSTGTPAVTMHPVEALHGDLGIVTDRHCLIAFSRSGNTDEIVRFVQHFRRLGGPVVGVTCGASSRLAELAQCRVLLPDLPEAGPHGLAPTTSCIMMLAWGDALAMALLEQRGFQPSDFANFHPEGSLGRRLLLRAEHLMHAGEQLPCVRDDASFEHLILEMNRKQLGLALIVHADQRLIGVFTDGDLRRIFERVADPRGLDARTAYARSRRALDAPPVTTSTVAAQTPAVDCLQFMRDAQITSLIVIDPEQRPIGVLRLMDLVRAGL